MSRENQIDELKKDLDTMIGNSSQLKAEKLFAKGWRKQSVGEWETEDTILGRCCVCSVCVSCSSMEYRYCPYCGAKMKGGE